jgi:hypothetical protein
VFEQVDQLGHLRAVKALAEHKGDNRTLRHPERWSWKSLLTLKER